MPGKKLKLVKINSALVAANEENYNSNFHTENEAPGEPIPTEDIPQESIQTTNLTNAQAQLIIDASRSSLHTRELSRIYTEELEELASSFQSLLFPSQGLLTTSHRATNFILRCMERQEGVELFFLPFDENMRTEKEYRVFCVPPDGRVTCISQYRWHKPNIFFGHAGEDVAIIIDQVKKGALSYHHEILLGLNIGNGGDMDKLLLKQGFTFDIMFDEGSGKCKFIEPNSFGARSGCGSCLFHWLNDGIYFTVELRISI
ncbi:hypothetical protein BDZ45DRAFT_709774 [Acephala macrosclerotiorum]|nr:hypothetical protein BDZ45DRAFT_709774 [Acephala macrosclerotiorum]